MQISNPILYNGVANFWQLGGGNFTVPHTHIYRVYAGGGGGGGAPGQWVPSTSSAGKAGGLGGQSGNAQWFNVSLTQGDVIAVTLGAGGTPGQMSSAGVYTPAGAGGITTFGSSVSVDGGAGGNLFGYVDLGTVDSGPGENGSGIAGGAGGARLTAAGAGTSGGGGRVGTSSGGGGGGGALGDSTTAYAGGTGGAGGGGFCIVFY